MSAVDFSYISVRARVAYSIQCLEALLKDLNLFEIEEWAFLLDKLWGYCDCESLEDWHEMFAEYTPFSVFGEDFETGDFLTRQEYDKLQVLYSYSSDVNEVIDLIFRLGTIDLYGMLNRKSEGLKSIYKVIDIMKKNGVKEPDVSRLVKFSFNECNGWGRRFNRNEI